MTTAFSILLTAYLIGYFISVGLIIGIHEKSTRHDAIIAGIFIGLLSWINIGIFLADFIPSKEKIKN